LKTEGKSTGSEMKEKQTKGLGWGRETSLRKKVLAEAQRKQATSKKSEIREQK